MYKRMCYVTSINDHVIYILFVDNMSYRGVVEREFLFQTVNNGAFSVDTFFFIR